MRVIICLTLLMIAGGLRAEGITAQNLDVQDLLGWASHQEKDKIQTQEAESSAAKELENLKLDCVIMTVASQASPADLETADDYQEAKEFANKAMSQIPFSVEFTKEDMEKIKQGPKRYKKHQQTIAANQICMVGLGDKQKTEGSPCVGFLSDISEVESLRMTVAYDETLRNYSYIGLQLDVYDGEGVLFSPTDMRAHLDDIAQIDFMFRSKELKQGEKPYYIQLNLSCEQSHR